MSQATSTHALTVGLFGIGLYTYWPQFPGSEGRLKGYTNQVGHKFAGPGIEVVNLGLIDTPEKQLKQVINFGVPMSISFFSTPWRNPDGQYKFSSWTLHMASIIIFSSLWGIGLKEWKGSGKTAGSLLALALALLVGSTVIVGYGNYLGLAH